MCRFYDCYDPRLLLHLPHHLFDLLARYMGRLQAEEDLRAAYVAALPWQKDDSGWKALRRLAMGEEGKGRRTTSTRPRGSSSRAEILALAAAGPGRGMSGGGVQIRRKGQAGESQSNAMAQE